MNEFHDIHKHITNNLYLISKFASGYAVGATLAEEAQDDPDFDYWHAFSDEVDLNFVRSADGSLKCLAYPVLDGIVNTSPNYEVVVPLNG